MTRPSLQGLERLELLRNGEVRDHYADRDKRERRGNRQVRPVVVVDDRADELLARDELRRDVVPEGQREREDRAGNDGGERERQRDLEERSDRPAAEVG